MVHRQYDPSAVHKTTNFGLEQAAMSPHVDEMLL
jgi:hypothetical protein